MTFNVSKNKTNMTFKFQKQSCINNVSYLGYDEYDKVFWWEALWCAI